MGATHPHVSWKFIFQIESPSSHCRCNNYGALMLLHLSSFVELCPLQLRHCIAQRVDAANPLMHIGVGETGFSPVCSSISLSFTTPRPLHKWFGNIIMLKFLIVPDGRLRQARTRDRENSTLCEPQIADRENSRLCELTNCRTPSDKWISQQLEWCNLVLQWFRIQADRAFTTQRLQAVRLLILRWCSFRLVPTMSCQVDASLQVQAFAVSRV